LPHPDDPAGLSAVPAIAAAPAGSVQALWALCLAVAQARRAQAGPAVLPAGTLCRHPVGGWALEGAWDEPARALFAVFKPLLDQPAGGPAWVIAQLGQSLDGCVATRTGDSYFVNGPENLVHVHRLRALCDAVIVGAGTVAADNPRLTTRRAPGPNPVRVVLDPLLRLPPDAHVFRDGHAPTLWLCDARCEADAVRAVGREQVLAVAGLWRDDEAGPRLAAAVAALHARGLRLLFVEGGGVTVSRFLAQGCLDRLHLAVAPVVIGDGRPGLRFAGPARMTDCLRPRCTVHPMGGDQLWDLDVRVPAAGLAGPPQEA
jgi:diaminohydroxyphosphoribosylaminopyrimidine deaminase / 5-amino-6-(5-phosphoribosylamino)uracil reductase